MRDVFVKCALFLQKKKISPPHLPVAYTHLASERAFNLDELQYCFVFCSKLAPENYEDDAKFLQD